MRKTAGESFTRSAANVRTLGLYDMRGNVAERWSTWADDPEIMGDCFCNACVARGDSYASPASDCRCDADEGGKALGIRPGLFRVEEPKNLTCDEETLPPPPESLVFTR